MSWIRVLAIFSVNGILCFFDSAVNVESLVGSHVNVRAHALEFGVGVFGAHVESLEIDDISLVLSR